MDTTDIKQNDNFDLEEKSQGSRSILRDLPTFPKQPKKEKSGIKKNKSAPSISALQQQKLKSGLYLHETQIPRSLSAGFADYQPDQTLSLLMDLPMEAYMGVGGGTKAMKSLLQNALKKVTDDIIKWIKWLHRARVRKKNKKRTYVSIHPLITHKQYQQHLSSYHPMPWMNRI